MGSEINVRRDETVQGAEVCVCYSQLPRPKRQLNSQHGNHMINAPCPSWLIIVNKPRAWGGAVSQGQTGILLQQVFKQVLNRYWLVALCGMQRLCIVLLHMLHVICWQFVVLQLLCNKVSVQVNCIRIGYVQSGRIICSFLKMAGIFYEMRFVGCTALTFRDMQGCVPVKAIVRARAVDCAMMYHMQFYYLLPVFGTALSTYLPTYLCT